MPSSLTMVLPIALVCSTHPPVSVCGTGSSRLPRGFSRKRGLTGFARSLRPPPQPAWKARFTTFRPTWHRGDVQNPVRLPFSVAPSVMAPLRRCRNVYLLCIGYAFRPRLSSRLTLGGLALPRKPWVYGGVRPVHRGSSHGFAPDGKLPYRRRSRRPAASAPCLAPYIVGACPLDQ